MATTPPAPEMAMPALTLNELTRPSSEQTAQLLDLARQIYQVQPWQTLAEDAIFVVRNPADDALMFVGTIGGSGEQAGVIVYRGANAYFGLLDFLDRAAELPAIPQMAEGMEGADELLSMLAEALSQANFNPMELMQLPQLQLMFEPRDQLEDLDEELIERHGYEVTGAGFPTFRAVSSGFLPWWISDKEADALIIALQQLIEVVGRKDLSEELLEILEVEGTTADFSLEMFARISTKGAAGSIIWADQRLIIEPCNAPITLENAPDAGQVERILALPASDGVVEVALLGMSSPAGDAQTRPYFPTLLLLGHEQQVVATEMLPCGFGDALPPQVIQALVKLLSQLPNRPQKLQYVSSDLDILNAIGQTLGIAIEEVEDLETLDPAMEMMIEQMENFDPDDFDDDNMDEEDLMGSEANESPKFTH